MHTSIKLNTPIEFINVTPVNPLISRCEIKVCYVGEEPNRNGSVITKEVASQMANSLPGSPIVGFFNETKQDFEEHNRVIDVSNGKFEIKDTTRPYGFVDLNAKVWFQKFIDDGINEREYLMTEGYLWTEQYPECKRILALGNNQSMELDEKNLNANWSIDENGYPEFFIINEAIISKLCILGQDVEPCFEGASISAPTIQFSFDDNFKEQLFSMMNELKDLLNKGGEKVFTRYAVEIGDTLWTALYGHVCENYSIEGVYEDEDQKFAVLTSDDKYYRLNFSISDEEITFEEDIVELESYEPSEELQFAAEAVAAFAETFNKSETEEEEEDEDEEVCEKCGRPLSECECEEEEEEEEKVEYVLDEIPEYVELQQNYAALEQNYQELLTSNESLTNELASLREFKSEIDKKNKQDMIDSFYMLSDEDKADVLTNIDTYSLEDIEAKLSIICVRNKVSFNLDNDDTQKGPVTYSIVPPAEDDTPAWVKAALAVAKNKN